MNITRETHTFATEAEWLAMREKDLTSTEAAALFDASPYATEYDLHHIKTGQFEKPFESNERMVWGNRLEAAIAYGVAEDYGLVIEPFKCYMRIPELRMGSSFDFKIVGITEDFIGNRSARDMFRQHGPGIMEVKNVDGLQFRRNWIEDAGEIEAPPHIEFQVQHQLEVAGLGWSLISPLVGGNTPKVVVRERDTELGAVIRERVAHFWARIDAGIAPEPDYEKDAKTISRLYVENDGGAIDLTDNTRVAELCRSYKDAGADEKAAKGRKDAAKAELLTIIEAAKSVRTDGYKISAGTNKQVFKAYRREEGERMTITISRVPAADIEATVPAFRNVRITEAA